MEEMARFHTMMYTKMFATTPYPVQDKKRLRKAVLTRIKAAMPKAEDPAVQPLVDALERGEACPNHDRVFMRELCASVASVRRPKKPSTKRMRDAPKSKRKPKRK